MRGGRGGGGYLDAGNDDDPAAKYLRQVQNESRRAFNEISRGEEVAAQMAGPSASPPPAPMAAAAANALLRRFMPALRAPTTLPPEALPTPAFVTFTVDHFDFVKEYLTAARGAVVAATMTGSAKLLAACPPRPTNAPGVGASRRQWAEFMARAVASDTYGPPLSSLVHTDYVGTVHAISVACQNLARGGSAPQHLSNNNEDAKRQRCESNTDSSSSSSAGSDVDSAGSGDDAEKLLPRGKATAAEPAVTAADSRLRTVTVDMDDTCEVVVTGANAATAAAVRFAFWTTRGGGGAWLFASLAAAHATLDPDTQRLLQNAFTNCVDHLKTLASARPDLFTTNATESSIPPPPSRVSKVTVSPGDVTLREVRGVQTVLIVLGKIFRQANPALIPL